MPVFEKFLASPKVISSFTLETVVTKQKNKELY